MREQHQSRDSHQSCHPSSASTANGSTAMAGPHVSCAGQPLGMLAARASRRSSSTRPAGAAAGAGAGPVSIAAARPAEARTIWRGASGAGATYGAGAGPMSRSGGLTVSGVASRPSTVNTALGLQQEALCCEHVHGVHAL